MMKKAIQMYSLRDHIKTGEDLLEVLGKVKELGFDGVEFAGYFGLDAKTIKDRLDELGLEVAGTHIGLQNLTAKNIEETIAFHKELGCKDIGIGGTATRPGPVLNRACGVLGNANKRAQEEGMRVYFHNHQEEFKPLMSGLIPMNKIMEACFIQLDTYWSACAGIDNYSYIKKHADKIVHLHLKDGIDCKPKALGEGDADLASVVKAAREVGFEWIVLENDNPKPNGLDDATRSMEYMKNELGL
ncbi:MAG: sugar phosphate isomerase/epimerase [Clostridiales bacterium]|nr:sugar phosphate isomerase/epimerase [Clostridiales bacterium]